MLQQIIIENFVLVERLELTFSNGLCVLTGETGAGKSLIIDAISAILGHRISPDSIKTNCAYSYLEATFTNTPLISHILKEYGYDELENSPTLTFSRTIQHSGSKSRINGLLANQSLIKRLAPYLVDILSQHANQILLKVENHLQILDQMGNQSHQKLLVQLGRTAEELFSYQRQHQELLAQNQSMQREKDFIEFQLNEIEEAELIAEEDVQLEKEKEILTHAETLNYELHAAYYRLYGRDDTSSICENLSQVCRALEKLVEHASNLEPLIENLTNLHIQLDEAAHDLQHQAEAIQADPARLQEVEIRLGNLKHLKKKYGSSIPEILLYAQEKVERLKVLKNSKQALDELGKKIEEFTTKYQDQSQQLRASRLKIAKKLEPLIEKELKTLGMEKTVFKVDIQSIESITPTGSDSVEFLLSPNPGIPVRPLAKIASGGENSRLFLAMKLILRQSNPVATMIFDEIDVGISGQTALMVSQKLADLSRYYQIICITHLPVIAAMAEQHLWIEKQATSRKTMIQVDHIEDKVRIEKLAQMTSGKVSNSSLKHAQELYHNALAFKEG